MTGRAGGRGSAPRGATAAGAVGNVVEWYDFAVFGASATLLATAFTAGGDNALTGVFAVFALSFVFRPLGAVLVGTLADRAGRREPLVATVLLMTLATTAVGLLPTWAAAGATATVLLLLLRAAQGFSSGGELAVSVAYLVEHAPAGRRGARGGVHMATMALGFAAGIGVVAVLHRALGAETMTAWGWRLPFLVALPLGAVGLYLRWKAEETPDFREHTIGRLPQGRPLLVAVTSHRTVVGGGFLLTAALTCSFNLWFVYLPSRLVSDDRFELAQALAGALLGLLTMAASAVACGRLSDRWGRRPLLLVAVGGVGALWLLAPSRVTDGSMTALLVTDVLMGASLGAFVLQSALSDRLPVGVRASGMALSFGLASAVVGGTAPLVASLLHSAEPAYVPVYALLWTLPAAVVAARWPRRRAGAPAPGALPRTDVTALES